MEEELLEHRYVTKSLWDKINDLLSQQSEAMPARWIAKQLGEERSAVNRSLYHQVKNSSSKLKRVDGTPPCWFIDGPNMVLKKEDLAAMDKVTSVMMDLDNCHFIAQAMAYVSTTVRIRGYCGPAYNGYKPTSTSPVYIFTSSKSMKDAAELEMVMDAAVLSSEASGLTYTFLLVSKDKSIETACTLLSERYSKHEYHVCHNWEELRIYLE